MPKTAGPLTGLAWRRDQGRAHVPAGATAGGVDELGK